MPGIRVARRAATLVLVLCPFGLAGAPARSQTNEPQVKAAFVFNFAKYVDWPAEAFGSGQDDLVACFLGGPDPFLEAMHDIGGKVVKGRNLVVRPMARTAVPRGCHMLVIGDQDANSIDAALKRADGLHVLTVGDSSRFMDAGGMIRLFNDGGRMRFDVNLGVARRANLLISAALLRVARQVRQ